MTVSPENPNPNSSRRVGGTGLTPARPERRVAAADTRAALLLAGAAVLIGLALLLVGIAQVSSNSSGSGIGSSVWPPLAKGRLLLGGLLILAALVAYALHSRGSWKQAVAVVLVFTVLGSAGHAYISGWGLHASSLAGSVVAIVLAGVFASRWVALAVAGLHLTLVLGLYAAELQGVLHIHPGQVESSATDSVVGQVLLTLAALLAAEVVTRTVAAGLSRAMAEQRRLGALLGISSDWTWEMNAAGRITYLSPSFEKHTGRTVAEFLLDAKSGGPKPVNDDNLTRTIQALESRSTIRNQALTVRCHDGVLITILSSGEPIFDNSGALTGWWGVSRNITDAERARVEGDAILDNASVGIALIRGRRFERVNPLFESMFGFAPQSLAGQPTSTLLPDPAEHDLIVGMAHRTLGKGQALDMEHSMPRASGTRVLTRLRARPVDPARPHESGSIWVAEDISERRRNEVELDQAKQQAEAANHAKSAFLATMSHEIRTPLNGVLGLARLLQDPKLDGHKRREYLSHLEDSAQQLTSMVSDVLDLSKIEAGHLVIESIAFDLHELLASVFASFAPLGQERGLTMQQHIARDVPRHVLGDPVRVRQILANYMSNALKFTTQGQVDLRASLQGEKPTVRLAVHDTGVGVAPDVQARLFHPFAQADSSTTRRFGGTGLGLSICRELAQRMGGHVGVSSVGPGGGGSVFWADLPLPASRDTQPDADLQHAAQRPLQGLCVLVAEDNPVNMLIAVAQLTQLGATVLQAVDGEAAVQIALQMAQQSASQQTPGNASALAPTQTAAQTSAQSAGQATPVLHAVLMDLHMPNLDGLAATRALRAHPLTAHLPVFALSAAVLEHERQQVVQAGMNGFIAKPAQEAELVQVLLGAMALSQSTRPQSEA
jgi:PAS domain S-box-containing protein